MSNNPIDHSRPLAEVEHKSFDANVRCERCHARFGWASHTSSEHRVTRWTVLAIRRRHGGFQVEVLTKTKSDFRCSNIFEHTSTRWHEPEHAKVQIGTAASWAHFPENVAEVIRGLVATFDKQMRARDQRGHGFCSESTAFGAFADARLQARLVHHDDKGHVSADERSFRLRMNARGDTWRGEFRPFRHLRRRAHEVVSRDGRAFQRFYGRLGDQMRLRGSDRVLAP